MKKPFTSARMLLLFGVFALCCVRADAQAVPALEKINSQAELEKAIATLDAALFDAYNRCDLEKFASFLADDVEFYHDKAGVTLGKGALADAIKKNICGQSDTGTRSRDTAGASPEGLWRGRDGCSSLSPPGT
jgi:hypothetical protein